MTDRFIFVVSPYLTAAAAVPGSVVGYVLWSRRNARARSEPASNGGMRSIRAAWRWAIGLVVAGHVLGLAFPEIVLRWNQQPMRLLVLEGAGLTAGIVALAALIWMLVQRLQTSDLDTLRSPVDAVDVVVWTLLAIEMLSGLVVAAFYRWGSSWSAVTVAPYLHSVLRFDPDAVLVARLPLAARLHLFCAFALIAVVPFSGLARVVIVPADRLARWIAARAPRIALPSWCALDDWSARLQPLRVRLTRHEGEEN